MSSLWLVLLTGACVCVHVCARTHVLIDTRTEWYLVVHARVYTRVRTRTRAKRYARLVGLLLCAHTHTRARIVRRAIRARIGSLVACVYAPVHACVCTCMCARMCVCMHARVRACAGAHVRAQACVSARMRVCAHVCAYAPVRTRARVPGRMTRTSARVHAYALRRAGAGMRGRARASHHNGLTGHLLRLAARAPRARYRAQYPHAYTLTSR